MTWFDPDAWKLPADLIDNWKTIAGGVVAIGGAVGSLAKWGMTPLWWVWARVKRERVKPNRPLRFVYNELQSHWGPRRVGDKQGTSAFGRWHVTNMSDRDVVLLRARLASHQAKLTRIFTLGPVEFDSMNLIPAHEMTEVIVDFTFFPAIRDGREPLIADVVFTDNYEEEHRVPSVRFHYMGP